MDLSYSDETREDGGILIGGRLKHLPSGHFEDSFMPAPLDTTGGNSDVQATHRHLRLGAGTRSGVGFQAAAETQCVAA